MTLPRPPRDPKTAALEVLALAWRVSTGEVPLPRDGVGPTRVDGRVVVPAAIHGLLCGSHVATRWDPVEGQPAVKECHGCGLLRFVDDSCGGVHPDPPAGPIADVIAIGTVR